MYKYRKTKRSNKSLPIMSSSLLIGLVGKKQSGKDTMADYMITYSNEHYHHDFIKISFAQPLKTIVKELFSLQEEQLHDSNKKETVIPQWNKTPRQLLQWLGTDILKKYVGDDIFIIHLENRIKQERERNPGIGIIVTDVRFENEAALIRRLNGTLIRVQEEQTTIAGDEITQKQDMHISETESEKIDTHFTIYNNKTYGMDPYKEKIRNLVHIIFNSCF